LRAKPRARDWATSGTSRRGPVHREVTAPGFFFPSSPRSATIRRPVFALSPGTGRGSRSFGPDPRLPFLGTPSSSRSRPRSPSWSHPISASGRGYGLGPGGWTSRRSTRTANASPRPRSPPRPPLSPFQTPTQTESRVHHHLPRCARTPFGVVTTSASPRRPWDMPCRLFRQERRPVHARSPSGGSDGMGPAVSYFARGPECGPAGSPAGGEGVTCPRFFVSTPAKVEPRPRPPDACLGRGKMKPGWDAPTGSLPVAGGENLPERFSRYLFAFSLTQRRPAYQFRELSLIPHPEGNPPLSQVVRREFDFYSVTRNDPDEVLPHLPTDPRDDHPADVEFDAERCIREGFLDPPLDLDGFFLRHDFRPTFDWRIHLTL
jgi:hypothetical protein